MENSGPEPGQTITPSPAGTTVSPTPPPEPVPTPADPAPSATPSTEVPTGLRQLDSDDPAGQAVGQDDEDDEIVWTASEFVAHEKSSNWYIRLALAAVVIAAIVFLITRDVISVLVVVGGAAILGFYANHQPRQLEYRLGNDGLNVGQKQYAYDEFRSFAVAQEGAFSSIIFMPLKRFALPVNIYYAPEDEERIVGLLSDRLPVEEHAPDPLDRLMHRIRF